MMGTGSFMKSGFCGLPNGVPEFDDELPRERVLGEGDRTGDTGDDERNKLGDDQAFHGVTTSAISAEGSLTLPPSIPE